MRQLFRHACAMYCRGEHVLALFNFYPKLFTWVQLRKLILSKGFVEETHVFHNPKNKGGLPSELVLFRRKTVLLGVVKSWSSAADSSGRITNEQCEQCGQTIDFVKDLCNALEGKCTGSFAAIEAAIAKVLSDENFHQFGLVSAALSREMVTPENVNAFALSDLNWHNVLFRGGARSGASTNTLVWRSTCTLLKSGNLQEGVQNIACINLFLEVEVCIETLLCK